MKKTYDLSKKISKADYRSMLSALVDYIPLFALVVRDSLKLNQKGLQLLNLLRPYLVLEEVVTEWPGTKLYAEKAKRFVFKFDSESTSVLLEHADGIFDWMQPELPEDLSLLRNDKSPYFVSISHEKDLYFELTDDEYNKLVALLPNIVRLLQKH